ncbi:reverse transcriptase domain-containing protein [Tanacetum coccineum]
MAEGTRRTSTPKRPGLSSDQRSITSTHSSAAIPDITGYYQGLGFVPFEIKEDLTLHSRIIEFAGPEYKMPTNIKLYDGTADPEDHLGRFASAANFGEWPMPVWCRMFQQTLDEQARGWFECLPANSIDEWAHLREAFTTRYSVRKACFKEPHKITKIIRRANESLTTFKERWTVIMGVPEVMKISSFMDSLKCPELAKRWQIKAPTTWMR